MRGEVCWWGAMNVIKIFTRITALGHGAGAAMALVNGNEEMAGSGPTESQYSGSGHVCACAKQSAKCQIIVYLSIVLMMFVFCHQQHQHPATSTFIQEWTDRRPASFFSPPPLLLAEYCLTDTFLHHQEPIYIIHFYPFYIT